MSCLLAKYLLKCMNPYLCVVAIIKFIWNGGDGLSGVKKKARVAVING